MKLIERDEFLAAMHERFQQLTLGEGHCVFIAGEAGIGKTSLVKAFLKQVEQECIAYIGTCDSLFTPRPLAPLYDLSLQMTGDWVDKIQTHSSRAEMFTLFLQALTRHDSPVVLVFEDIHWADEATLDFVKFLSRRINRTRCLFVLTYRDNEIHQQHPFRKIPGDLVPGVYTNLMLSPLSRQAVKAMADGKGYDAEDVYTITGGNPFYVQEILANYSPGVPDTIKNAILAVYNRQEEKTKQAWQLLSVMPEGLEIERLAQVDASFPDALEHSLEQQLLIIRNNKIFFKHELYRRTIEVSLSPFKRIELNRQILFLFLALFEADEEIVRLVHYAKNANEHKLVSKYAPLAAKQSSGLGAHIEAAKLYLTAIEYTDRKEIDSLVELYENYSYECYLTNQIKNGIIYARKALKIWEDKNNAEKIGNSLRFLSRLWWFDVNREEAEKCAKQAIAVLEDQPSSRTKAMAYSNMSQLKMLSNEDAESIEWGNKAAALARELSDEEVLAHALNNLGAAQMNTPARKGIALGLLQESLAIALRNSFHEHVSRAYCNIISRAVVDKDWELVGRYLEEGLCYCEERDLDAWTNYKLTWKARMLVARGDWAQAEVIARNLLKNEDQSPVVKTVSLAVLATLKIRAGAPEALELVQQAKALALTSKEHQRIIPALIACLEFEWLQGKQIITNEELSLATDLVQVADGVPVDSEFAFWLQKARGHEVHLPEVYEPYALLNAGKTEQAACLWEEKCCPFEQALALWEGEEEDKRKALAILQTLGADAVYEKMKMEMRASGIKKIPRGLRESTRSNAAQLTKRELDVLQLLTKDIQNKEIAEALFISPKTVDHHISSILSKLEVSSRTKAVAEAIQLGILK